MDCVGREKHLSCVGGEETAAASSSFSGSFVYLNQDPKPQFLKKSSLCTFFLSSATTLFLVLEEAAIERWDVFSKKRLFHIKDFLFVAFVSEMKKDSNTR